jgi:selenocysteine lyase/cysteine desulfurase
MMLITDGTGMTGVVNKFQRILGLKVPENLKDFINVPADKKPVVFISHMEHHSNQTFRNDLMLLLFLLLKMDYLVQKI